MFFPLTTSDEKELKRKLKLFSDFIEKPIKNLELMKKEYKKLLNLRDRGLLCEKIGGNKNGGEKTFNIR